MFKLGSRPPLHTAYLHDHRGVDLYRLQVVFDPDVVHGGMGETFIPRAEADNWEFEPTVKSTVRSESPCLPLWRVEAEGLDCTKSPFASVCTHARTRQDARLFTSEQIFSCEFTTFVASPLHGVLDLLDGLPGLATDLTLRGVRGCARVNRHPSSPAVP